MRRDDRVIFVMSDGIELLGGILGAFRAGVVAVPVSTMLGGHELAEILADSGARLVFATPEYVDDVKAAIDLAPDVEHFVLAGADPLQALSSASARSWEDFISIGRDGTEHDRAVADTDDDTCALWLYTSGTTGSPKGAMHRHADIRHVCRTYGDQVLGIRPDDVCFSVAKLFFAYGLGNSALFPLSVGATTVLEPRHPTPEVIAERMARDKPTIFGGVPTFFASLVASDPVHRPVRGGDHRRHRVHRELEHLPVQPPRRHPPGHNRSAGARLRAAAARRHRRARAPGTARDPARPW